tara:strand:+ start:1329 stop:1700 length:372 start_codon:yes stop_codon:yes gene_type:complete
MASELRVTTVANNAGTESVNTTYVINGSAKAWFHYNQQAGNEAVRDSFNISSITDNSTGIYTNTFASNMNNSFYNVTGGTRGNRHQFNTDTGTTTGRAYRTGDANNTVNDADSNCWTTMGDLA